MLVEEERYCLGKKNSEFYLRCTRMYVHSSARVPFKQRLQRMLPLMPPFVVSSRAERKLDSIRKELRDMEFQQPCMLLFSWALEADINTDKHNLTLAILRGENVTINGTWKGRKGNEFIAHVNMVLEEYMRRWNAIYESWPLSWRDNAAEMCHAQKFAFDPLRERLRTLVASQGSDARSTPSTLRVEITPKAFYIALADHHDRAISNATRVDILFDAPSDLDFMLCPTLQDLTDSPPHNYFGHDMMSRWYSQMFDASNASDVDPATGLNVARALWWRVEGAVTLVYFRKTNTMTVEATWIGCHKSAAQQDRALWIEGTFANNQTN